MESQNKRTDRRTDRLAQALAKPILGGIWREGDKLPSDKTICAEHDVSRTVLREALRLLGGKGLIIARPRIGTRVAPRHDWLVWDPQILQWLTDAGPIERWLADAHDMRCALEPSFAALAAARADEAANTRLQEALRDLQTGPDAAREKRFLACLYAATGNRFAAFAAHLTQWAVHHRAGAPPLADYAALTAAIAQGDTDRARHMALVALRKTQP